MVGWLRVLRGWVRRGFRRRTYGFRIAFDLAHAGSLSSEDHELLLRAAKRERVALRVALPDVALKDATYLVLEGRGYRTEEVASASGERWRDVISRAFADVRLHADFGDRRPRGATITPAGADWLRSMFGTDLQTPLVAEASGVMTYPDDAKPKFIRMRGSGVSSESAESISDAVTRAEESFRSLSEAERIAFDLYSASFFQGHASDGRFLMLMMAVESLIETEMRPEPVRLLLDRWVDEVRRNSELTSDEAEGLSNALRSLHNEAIGRAGRRLADHLDPERYGGKRARRFFTDCYRLRSKLVHGQTPRPSWESINSQTGELERFVADLLKR